MPKHQIPADEELRKRLPDIQANVVDGIRWKCARYHFLKIVQPAVFADALAKSLAKYPLPTANTALKSPALHYALNISFTHPGLEALGVNPQLLDVFPNAFREGMAARAERLGDTGESAPEHWDRWLGTPDVHVLCALLADDED